MVMTSDLESISNQNEGSVKQKWCCLQKTLGPHIDVHIFLVIRRQWMKECQGGCAKWLNRRRVIDCIQQSWNHLDLNFCWWRRNCCSEIRTSADKILKGTAEGGSVI